MVKYIIGGIILIALIVFVFQSEEFKAGVVDLLRTVFSPISTSTLNFSPNATSTLSVYANQPAYTPSYTPVYLSPAPTGTLTFENKSPHYKSIRVETVSLGFGSDINSYVIYRARLKPAETVDINGWQIQTSRGFFTLPPSGFGSYSPPYGFPLQSLALSNGSAFVVHTGSNPQVQENNESNSGVYNNYVPSFFREYHFWFNFPLLDPYHETISLYDKDGGLVDEYKY